MAGSESSEGAAAAALSASQHAMLELRLVGTTLCRLLGQWLEPRGGPANLGDLARDCRAQLVSLTGPLRGVDDLGATAPADQERALRSFRAQARCDETPLSRLRQNAALAPIDVDLLLLAALPDESALWSALFQLLGGSPRPTVHLALNLWLESAADRVALTQRLGEGPLSAYQLLQVVPNDAPFASRMLCLPERLWSALLGGAGHDPLLAGAITRGAPPTAAFSLATREQLRRLGDRLAHERGGRVVVRGEPGSGRRGAAHALAARLGRSVVEVRWPTAEQRPEWQAALVRHALLHDAALLLLPQPGPNEAVTVDLTLPPALPAFLAVPERTEIAGATFAEADLVHLPAPLAGERAELWRAALSTAGVAGPDPYELGRVFRLRGGDVAGALHHAVRCAQLTDRSAVTVEDLADAVRERPARRLEGLTRRRQPRADWSHLVLSVNQLAQLREVVRRVRHRDRVFDEWAVAAHSGRQAGVVSLFAGPSGTGKTLAAEVVAGDLGLDLYCVDLSQTVSKYIGETEKSLSRIFDAAEGSAAVLFFDEADALFGKRTETRDAHDRYANQEVSYLLQRLETFDGITILASNLRQNIDAAFLRRVDFLIEFASPDVPARAQIWERHLRSKAPIEPDINPQWLAETFPVSGAHIRNAVVAAAFGAAADGRSLGVPHLLAAMRREYEKLGKPFPVRF